MVHVLAPQPSHKKLPMFFNVDSSVGQNGQNANPEDIMLVQYFLRLIGDHPSGIAAPSTPIFKRVRPTGTMDQATIDAIKAGQSYAKITPDGRVSKAATYRYGAHSYTIVDLNFSIRDRAPFKAKWPNVDQLPNCPPILGAAIRRALSGQG
ncbi:hypothetical protein [Muricoccus radiodurans]|uniref:hypothetical protein n=1 Tax=Muricoccus radiodurans TaxID=2231721 RepID=UPI003CEEF39F